MKYYLATRKQERYIALLCEQLGVADECRYRKYTMSYADWRIQRLRKQVERKKRQDILDRQLSLL